MFAIFLFRANRLIYAGCYFSYMLFRTVLRIPWRILILRDQDRSWNTQVVPSGRWLGELNSNPCAQLPIKMARANIKPANLQLNDILSCSLSIILVWFAMGLAFVPSSFPSKAIAVSAIVAYSSIAGSSRLILWLKSKQWESKRDEGEERERERWPVAVKIIRLGIIKLVVLVVASLR